MYISISFVIIANDSGNAVINKKIKNDSYNLDCIF